MASSTSLASTQPEKDVGSASKPAHARTEGRQPLGLDRAQVGRHFQDQVVGVRLAQRVQLAQHAFGQRAGAGAEFQYGGRAGLRQHVGGLARQRAREQRRELRRGDEVARRQRGGVGWVGQLDVAGRVVASPGAYSASAIQWSNGSHPDAARMAARR